jgi:hypothetical protein
VLWYVRKPLATSAWAPRWRGLRRKAHCRGHAKRMRHEAALIKGLMRRTAEDVIEIGNALIRQKDKLPHGMFLPWIEAEFEMSERTARKMMSVAEAYGKSAPNADLSMF